MKQSKSLMEISCDSILQDEFFSCVSSLILALCKKEEHLELSRLATGVFLLSGTMSM
jgi:hypothetical protein